MAESDEAQSKAEVNPPTLEYGRLRRVIRIKWWEAAIVMIVLVMLSKLIAELFSPP